MVELLRKMHGWPYWWWMVFSRLVGLFGAPDARRKILIMRNNIKNYINNHWGESYFIKPPKSSCGMCFFCAVIMRLLQNNQIRLSGAFIIKYKLINF